jgi:hypothetical protein
MVEISKYIDAAFDDKISAENYKEAALKCYNEITSNFANIQSKYEASPFELKKDECNIKFMAMMTCVEFQTFLVDFFLQAFFISVKILQLIKIIVELSERLLFGI